ncbi:hypothetical protein Tco_0550869 [Tanacetum coccineum]
MAPEFWCQTTPTEFWCHGISGAKLYFADVAPLLEFGTTTPCALSMLALGTSYSLETIAACGFALDMLDFENKIQI